MALLFYPRGGSAEVTRYLSRALQGVGWDVALVCGSLGTEGMSTHAASFFAGLSLTAADYGPALRAHAAGLDSLEQPVPMHPSFEDAGDASDPVFAAVPRGSARTWSQPGNTFWPAHGLILNCSTSITSPRSTRPFNGAGRADRWSPTCTAPS